MTALAVLLGLAVLLVGGGVYFQNRLVAMRRLVENAWSDVDVYLRRRADLIPNVVQTVRGAAAYEADTLERLSSARRRADEAGALPERGSAEGAVGSRLAEVIAVAERYPELQANQTFLGLQRELAETERLIASARQYYNACVRDYNILRESFPANLIANALGFRARDFFELDSAQEARSPEIGGLG